MSDERTVIISELDEEKTLLYPRFLDSPFNERHEPTLISPERTQVLEGLGAPSKSREIARRFGSWRPGITHYLGIGFLAMTALWFEARRSSDPSSDTLIVPMALHADAATESVNEDKLQEQTGPSRVRASVSAVLDPFHEEKRAADLLIANDYEGARAAFRLLAREFPDNADYHNLAIAMQWIVRCGTDPAHRPGACR